MVSGQSRAVVTDLKSHSDRGGVAPGQGIPGVNRWISKGLPADIRLTWSQPKEISQVEVRDYDYAIDMLFLSANFPVS